MSRDEEREVYLVDSKTAVKKPAVAPYLNESRYGDVTDEDEG